MIEPIRSIVRSRLPGLHAWMKRTFRKYPRLAHSIGRRLDWRVSSGPFAGMRYHNVACGSRLIPKLLGSYEMELHPWIDALAARAFKTIIDVGCAEGYYAVGLALRVPGAEVHAYDICPDARRACAQLAELNDVSRRIHVGQACTPRTLADLPLEDALIVCDCEGYEGTLLDLAVAPGLRRATMLIELHEVIVPGTTDLLRVRFQPTHVVDLVAVRPRDPALFPVLQRYRRDDQLLAVDEDRTLNGRPTDQHWMLLTPKL